MSPTTMTTRAPPGYRVMAEYGSSGLWRVATRDGGLFRHGMVEHAQLALPPALAEALTAWIDTYERDNLAGRLDAAAFNAEGLRIARALKAHLGPESHVEHQAEADDGSLVAPVVVDC
jgi:hypothetical protein